MYRVRDEVEIKLKYTGRDVDDGTMSVEDMIPALQGFASAYGKIASANDMQLKHRLRVIGVSKGSFDILLQIVADAIDLASAHADLVVKGALGYFVIEKIVGVIKITKHVKNQPFDTQINGDHATVNLINIDNVSLEMPFDVYELYKSKVLQPDIAKIVKPLESGKIESTEILINGGNKNVQEKINVSEKSYFDTEIKVIAKTELLTLMGSLDSLHKKTNNGFFTLNDGTRVSYHIAADKPEALWPHFIHKGPVQVKCIVQMDENLKPALLEIFEIELLQNPLNFEEEIN